MREIQNLENSNTKLHIDHVRSSLSLCSMLDVGCGVMDVGIGECESFPPIVWFRIIIGCWGYIN